MFLRNHGVVCCGRSIEEAWLIAYHTVLAVQTQLKMMPYGMDNLILIGKHFLDCILYILNVRKEGRKNAELFHISPQFH